MWRPIDLMMGMRPERRRNNGMGTFTAMVIGAGVGIAAWEAARRGRNLSLNQVMKGITGQAQNVFNNTADQEQQ